MFLASGRRRLVSGFQQLKRSYYVLAIESSCDDSAVALLKRDGNRCELLHHAKTALNSAETGGIMPHLALDHHAGHIAPLAAEALNILEAKTNGTRKVDVVAATRGPGMYSSLLAGFQVAKGISLAQNVPLVGVHHMLGHLLMPRFPEFATASELQFPMLSLLVSGGHTIVVLSKSVFDHEILANTIDIAAGNALDKCARALGMKSTMMAKELDQFTQPGLPVAELPPGLKFALPLENKREKTNELAAFSFASYVSQLSQRTQREGLENLDQQPEEIRRALGSEVQNSLFEHISRKLELCLSSISANFGDRTLPLVVSGGVAANTRLRAKLETLQSQFPVKLYAAPAKWCTDNALMIGWAGIEMFEAGVTTSFSEVPQARWPLPELKYLSLIAKKSG